METLDAIRSRRSIRVYQANPVSGQQLEAILRAGMAAPSAMDEQPWEFVLLTDPAALRELAAIHPHAQMVSGAAAAIVICCDLERTRLPDFWVQDLAAATQNMLLAAHDLGLGAVWTGIFPTPNLVAAFRGYFSLPERIVPFAMLPVGHPAEPILEKETFKPERIHRDRWS